LTFAKINFEEVNHEVSCGADGVSGAGDSEPGRILGRKEGK